MGMSVDNSFQNYHLLDTLLLTNLLVYRSVPTYLRRPTKPRVRKYM